ncbi:MAG: HAD-IA family hydrolase [Candidatus Xenobia bacterium]
MLSAIIFDWDGVLVDSEPIFHRVERRLLREACEEANVPCTDEALDRVITGMSGMGAQEAFAWCRQELRFNREAVDMVTAWLHAMQDPYQESRLIPQALETVQRLRPQVRLAVATSSPHRLVDPLMERLAMRSLFGTVVTAEEVAHPKPAPDIYLEAARRIGVPAVECVAIEDSPAGTRAAVAAGMRCVSIPRRATLYGDFTGATRIARALSDLTPEFLEALDRPPDPQEAGLAAALYARCQPHRRASALLFQQLAAAGALARARGWNVVAQFHDEAGDPGNGFAQLLQMAKTGQLKRIVVTEPSVLSRGVLGQADLIRELDRWGVQVRSVFRKEPLVRDPGPN